LIRFNALAAAGLVGVGGAFAAALTISCGETIQTPDAGSGASYGTSTGVPIGTSTGAPIGTSTDTVTHGDGTHSFTLIATAYGQTSILTETHTSIETADGGQDSGNAADAATDSAPGDAGDGG
jgi:hypothetical protein